MNFEYAFYKVPGCLRLLILSLFLAASSASAAEGGLFAIVAPWLPAETLLDNTDRATAPLSPMPGWAASGGAFNNAFGATFKTGPSDYRLRSATFLVAPPENGPAFSGDLKVSLYEVPEGKFPPAEQPFYEVTHKGLSIGPNEAYVSLNLSPPTLKANTWYGIAVSAPNQYMTRILGYQIPPRAPTPAQGFENGVPLWGEPKTWRSLGYPYLWIEGWDVSGHLFLRMKLACELGVWVAIAMAGFFIVRFFRRQRRI